METPEGKTKWKVLVVEDNHINRALVRRLLERFPFEVVAAENGKQGLQKFKEERFDLVIMDIQMPIMCGLESTRKIREFEAERGTSTPIIALTANAMEGDRKKCLDAGMDEYLTKPVASSVLIDTLQKFLPELEEFKRKSPQ